MDGVDIDSVTPTLLRQHVVGILQDSHLLAGSIRSNLAGIAQPTAGAPTVSDAEVWEALASVGLDAMVRGLPGVRGFHMHHIGLS